MEKTLAAKQALSQIAVESLGKNVLKTYYFLLAAASFSCEGGQLADRTGALLCGAF